MMTETGNVNITISCAADPGLADFSRECPEEIEIKITFTKYAYTESEFR